MQKKKSNPDLNALDAVIVGAGFAGLYMLHRFKQLGLRARILEAGGGVGGTWYWNRYPGARCDIPSLQYSYQFSPDLEQEWEWQERYAAQPEIMAYAEHVVKRFELAADIQFNTRVSAAHFDEERHLWNVSTETSEVISARFCVMATGCLSSANDPEFAGRENFTGNWYHTGRWPHEGVDFTGQRVAVIGTGSSAIQSIPLIAEQAAELTVFQRTANFSVPAHNRPQNLKEQAAVKKDYRAFRENGRAQPIAWDTAGNERTAEEHTPEEILAECERRWDMGGLYFYGTFADLLVGKEANDIVAEFVRSKIRERVEDPALAELLSPDTIFGCKRVCADTDYFETYNRPNVTLVDIAKTGIDQILADGVRANGQDYTVDAIVTATGFDAMTGSLDRIDITGKGGLKLKEKWHAGPRTYLGLTTAGFPNFFIISGPGSPSVLTNMITSIEQHVEFIADCVAWLQDKELASIDASLEAEDEWVNHVNEVAGETLLLGCNSWYLGANVPGKPRVFMPYLGFPEYVEKCETVANNAYEGFHTASATA
jgi:cation diffusion facilitator CzcD-associated flavoprotein CzcO